MANTRISSETGIDKVQDGSIGLADFDPSLFAFTPGASISQSLPGGFMIKVGSVITGADGTATITFPLPTFTAAPFVFVSSAANYSIGAYTQQGFANSGSTMSIIAKYDGVVNAVPVAWLAVGK